MRGGSYPDMPFNQQVTFPRELTLRTTAAGPRLFRKPVRELVTLHDTEETWTTRRLSAGQSLALAPSGDLFRIQAELQIDAGATLTLNVRGTSVVLNQKTVACGTKPIALADELTNI